MPPNFEVLLLRHRDAQAALACGASHYWRLVRKKKIQILGKGKAGRATAASIRAYVASLEAEAEAPKAA
jgi:hypothetical protein